MARIVVDVSGIVAKLNQIKGKLVDMTPFFKNVADLEWSQTLQRYKKQVDPEGKAWPEPFTMRRGQGPETGSGRYSTKRGWDYVVASNYHATPPGYRFFSKSRGDRVLLDTGTMMRSIGRAYDKDSAVVGTNLSYAKKHQDGIGVKQRRFLGINNKTEQNIQKAFDAYVKGALK